MSDSPLGPDTAALAVRFLGGLNVRQQGLLLPHPFPTRMTASLFAFLLLHPHVEHARDGLAASFWPDVEEEAALRSLRAALVPIRKLLEPLPEQKGAFLVSHRDILRLIPPPGCWVDVWAFQQARSAARDAPSGSPEWFTVLEGAVALYDGDLLPDSGDDWCTALREELRERFLEYLHQLTEAEEARRQYGRGGEWARRALAVDACDEESHRSLMRLAYRLGESGRALNQYRECRRALREELDAPPSAETIALYQWLRAQRDREPLAPAQRAALFREIDLLGPLVGRERELARLEAGWERTRAGRGELILLTGEAGIGKSRLGRQMLQGVALAGGLALSGQASALESSFLYRPLIDPLRRALELAAREGLRLCAPVWLGQVARLLPELRQGEAPLPVEEGESPRLLEEGIAQLLLTLAAQRPMCLFLDDLQWVDPATGRFLHYLARQAREARLLLVGAYREGEVAGSDWLGAWVTEVEAQRLATSLPLARLKKEEVSHLLERLAEGRASDTLVHSLGERLYEETEGNPLFLLETLRDLFERGYLGQNEEGRWHIASALLAPSAPTGETTAAVRGKRSVPRLPMPATVQRVVRQRVGRLGEEDRQLLACAAVTGRRFTFEALQRAAGRELEPALAGMERLLAADLIRAHAHLPGYDFRHDKIREVVYEDLVPIRRQEWHRRVGEALETIYGVAEAAALEEHRFPNWFRRPPPPPAEARVEEHAEELARHFHEAAPLIGPEKAVRYYLLAGTRARALSAYEEAVSDLLTARSLLAELLPEPTRLGLWGQVVTQLAPAYVGTGRGEAARAALEDYIDQCEQHGYAKGIARGCSLLGQFLELHRSPEGAELIVALYERAVAVCEAHGLVDEVVYPQSHLAFTLVWLGFDPQRAEALARACLTLAADRRDALLSQRLYTTLMWTATRRRDLAAFREAFRAALDWGGPYEVPLKEMLEVLEEACHHSGEDATFIDLCRQLADDCARAGREPPLQHWYLAPVPSPPPPGNPVVREEFDTRGWRAPLTWHDPTGRSKLDRTARRGWLGLAPAVGADLWPESNLNAPRLMTSAPGDFVAQARLALAAEAFIFAGLLLWQDERNFVRLELRDLSSERIAVHVEACLEGRFRLVGRGHHQRQTMWLRLQRAGANLQCLCSADAQQWLDCGSLLLAPRAADQVGLFAIHRKPGAQVWFDSFWLWHSRMDSSADERGG